MINILTVENRIEFILKFKVYKCFDDTKSIEDTFRMIVQNKENAFKDEMSLKIMQEIDHAVRVGDYGVRTRIGKSCITCLSTGCKLALLLWYYKDLDIKIFTFFYNAGQNVWKFISENFDICIYTEFRGFSCMDAIELTVDGVLYTKENYNDLRKLEWAKSDELYNITKKKEEKAYSNFLKLQDKYIQRDLKETLSLKDFIKGIEPDFYRIGGEECSCDYTVINYCSNIPEDYTYKRHPIWFIGNKDSKYEFFESPSVKYPTFLELLYDDILCGYSWEEKEIKYYLEVYDEFFALVLDESNRCKVDEYPEAAMFGVLCKPKEKLVIVYDKNRAVNKFHKFYHKV